MFGKSNDQWKKSAATLEVLVESRNQEIANLKKQIEFYEKRGDRYFTLLKSREDEAEKLLLMSKELLQKLIAVGTDKIKD